jgi:predicted RNA binding protein YcfA (HicA-like mRNA interferase family)
VSKLPRISGREVVSALAKAGYEFDRQKGSHITLRNPRPPFRRIVVPDHREVAKGTLRAIIRESGLTVEEFVSLLSKGRS